MPSESIFISPSEEGNTKEFRDLWLNWGQTFKIVLNSWSLRFWPWRAICPPGTGFKVDFSIYKPLPPSSPLPQASWVTTGGERLLSVPWHAAFKAVPAQLASSEGELGLWWGWASADSLHECWSLALGEPPVSSSVAALLRMKRSSWSYQPSSFHEQ